mgnify:CR=1 FL=1
MVRVTASLSKQVAGSQEWKCKKCAITLPSAYQIDHIKPKSQGGSNELDNLQALCPNCHAMKTQKEPKAPRKPKFDLPQWWPTHPVNSEAGRYVLNEKHGDLLTKDPNKLSLNELKVYVYLKTTKVCNGDKKDLMKSLENFKKMYDNFCGRMTPSSGGFFY